MYKDLGGGSFDHKYRLNDGNENIGNILFQTQWNLKSQEHNAYTNYAMKRDTFDHLLPRQLQSRESSITCGDRHTFRIELQLDQYPDETSWELRDDSSYSLLARQKKD